MSDSVRLWDSGSWSMHQAGHTWPSHTTPTVRLAARMRYLAARRSLSYRRGQRGSLHEEISSGCNGHISYTAVGAGLRQSVLCGRESLDREQDDKEIDGRGTCTVTRRL